MLAGLPRVSGAGLLALAFALIATVMVTPGGAEASAPWKGFVKGDHANVRSAPTSTATIVEVLGEGDTVVVAGWVSGEEVETQNNSWAELGDGGYV